MFKLRVVRWFTQVICLSFVWAFVWGILLVPKAYAQGFPAVGVANVTTTLTQSEPSVAHGASRFGIVWRQVGGGSRGIFFTSIPDTGTIQSGTGTPVFSVTTTSMVGEFSRPRIAALPTGNFVVVWSQLESPTGPNLVYGAVVSPSGMVVVAPTQLNGTGTSGASPAVACRASECAVVWIGSVNNGFESTELVARVYPLNNGTPTGFSNPQNVVVPATGMSRRNPMIAADGIGYQVVYNERSRMDSTSPMFLQGRRIAVGAMPTATGAQAIATSNPISPSTAADLATAPGMGRTVVVWGSNSSDVFVRELNDMGVPVTAEMRAPAPSGNLANPLPTVYWDGRFFVVIWTEARLGAMPSLSAGLFQTTGFYTVGTVQSFPVTNVSGDQSSAAPGQGNWGVVVFRHSDNVSHVFATMVRYSAFTQPCDEDVECVEGTCESVGGGSRSCLLSEGDPCIRPDFCRTGFCVDGRCCNTACTNPGEPSNSDCQACSVRAGASADGVCTILSQTTVCGNTTMCQQVCNGVSASCPADTLCCMNSLECEDMNPCTNNNCVNNRCVVSLVPGCVPDASVDVTFVDAVSTEDVSGDIVGEVQSDTAVDQDAATLSDAETDANGADSLLTQDGASIDVVPSDPNQYPSFRGGGCQCSTPATQHQHSKLNSMVVLLLGGLFGRRLTRKVTH